MASDNASGAGPSRSQSVPLKDSIQFTLDEARMILPGIQALFGFQLIAVFNERFESALDPSQRAIHLLALLLVAIACALVMAPAAYHRQAEQGQVSEGLQELASRLIGIGLVPLMFGICLDIYVVAFVVTEDIAASAGLGGFCFLVFAGLWFVFPWFAARRAGRGLPRPG